MTSGSEAAASLDRPMRRVHLVNDAAALNTDYRSSLMETLGKRGFAPAPIGLFEGGRLRVLALARLAAQWRDPVVVSNLRSNLCILMLPHLRGLVILNGLGRHRRSRRLRQLMTALLRVNRRKSVAVQNLADYRFFRRFTRSPHLAWVPGSGGTRRRVGSANVGVLVQRDDKIACVAASLNRLLSRDRPFDELRLVGCTDKAAAAANLSGAKITYPGRVPQDALFDGGRIFVQPGGYGEGIPHSLVDAVLSDMEIWIDQRLFLEIGLGRLGAQLADTGNGWGRMIYSAQDLSHHLAADPINTRYLDLLENAVAGKPVA